MRFLLQHDAGLGELVHPALTRDLSAKIIFADDSAVLVESDAAVGKVAGLSYLTNAHLVYGSVRRRGRLDRAAEELAGQVAGMRPGKQPERLAPGRPFRLMYSDAGKLVSVHPKSRSRLESALAKQLGGRLDRRGGGRGLEFWVIARRDHPQVFLGRRITRRRSSAVPPGALRPELASLLVSASEPRKSDVFLDPFGGSGALVAARLATACRRAIYSDTALAEHRGRLHPSLARSAVVTLLDEDARRLPSVADGSVDVIVTDPPWNEYAEVPGDRDEFAEEMLACCARVLRAYGRLVLLTSRQTAEPMAARWERHPLQLRRRIDILVNGHPASVLAGRRTAR